MTDRTSELTLGRRTTPDSPERRRVFAAAYAGAVLIHLLLFGMFMWTPRVRIGPANLMPQRAAVSVFVNPAPQPVATTGVTPVPKKIDRPKTDRPAPEPAAPQASSAGSSETTQASGPVRVVSGQDVQLLKKVQPIYPPTMAAAGIEGQVILDAVIERDGSIGAITVLQSSSALFERAAILAVKQWRYTPLPYEGIVTVTLNFVRQS